MTCASCVYCRVGYCHRYPPQLLGTTAVTAPYWPTVKPDEWCGEYTDKASIKSEPAAPKLPPEVEAARQARMNRNQQRR